MAENVINAALQEYVINHQCGACRVYGNGVVSACIDIACDCNTNVVTARRLLRYDPKENKELEINVLTNSIAYTLGGGSGVSETQADSELVAVSRVCAARALEHLEQHRSKAQNE